MNMTVIEALVVNVVGWRDEEQRKRYVEATAVIYAANTEMNREAEVARARALLENQKTVAVDWVPQDVVVKAKANHKM